MAVAFDGEALLITLESGVVEVDARADLYTEWKIWQKTPGGSGNSNRRYPPAFRVSGGDQLTTVLDAGGYFFLRNDLGWRIKPPEEDINITVIGNLVGEDETEALLIPTDGNFTVLVQGLQPITQRVEKVGDLVVLASYAGIIHLDTAGGGAPGDELGINGTPDNPSDNLADTLSIASQLGTKSIKFNGNVNVGATDFTGFDLQGSGSANDILISTGANFTDASIRLATLVGSMTGVIRASNCRIGALTGAAGVFDQCSLASDIVMPIAGGAEALFVFCSSAVAGPGGTPSLNLNGAAGNFYHFRAYSGGIEIFNSTSPDNLGSIDLISGQVILGPTNIDGTITVRGVGNMMDTSDGLTIEQDAFINKLNITSTMQATIDRIEGIVGHNQVLAVLAKNANGDAVSQRIRHYDTLVNADADDGATGLLDTYIATATYDVNDKLDSFKMTRAGS